MKFKIIKCLSEGESKTQHDINLPQYVINFISSEVDSKNVYRAYVELESIEKLVDLGFYFDKDIVIYGMSLDILTTIDTLKELGWKC